MGFTIRMIGDRQYSVYDDPTSCLLPSNTQIFEFFWDEFARLYFYDIPGNKYGYAMEKDVFDAYLKRADSDGCSIYGRVSNKSNCDYVVSGHRLETKELLLHGIPVDESAVLEKDRIEDIQKKIAEVDANDIPIKLGWGRAIPVTNADATRDDREKPRTDLLDASSMLGVADVLTFGAKKYAANNWKKGFVWGRIISSMLRHLFAFMRGEDIDKESGLPHVDHIACNAMFLQWHYRNRKDLDDRYVETKETP